ncbi:hypothetical protein ACA040_004719 [Xenophilus aerolatus]
MSAELDNLTSDADLLRRSAFFDPAYYLARNPDVAAGAIDPISHYLGCGAQEGRDPSPDFSTTGYLELYPDVAAQGLNPLVHFLRCGLAEGRDTGVDMREPIVAAPAVSPIVPASDEDHELVLKSGLFDPEYYLARYPDVAAAGLDPLGHYLSSGVKEGRDPSESFSTSDYLRRHQDVAALGLNPLLHYLRYGRHEGRTAARAQPLLPSLLQLFEQRWPALRPLLTFSVPATRPRVNVVTDSVSPSQLFGGVGTALILATLLANRLDATLRLITRTDPPDARALTAVLRANGLELAGAFETVHAPLDGSVTVEMGPVDLILTTSWWSTYATLRSVPTNRVIYLLQEDERMFYPHGDDRLLCAETLATPGLSTVVNTQLLHSHLTVGPHAVPGLAARATWFEPAFVSAASHPPHGEGHKLRLFFYSRPHNLRNLFWRGAMALCDAIERGILDPDQWQFYFVGKDTPAFVLPRGVKPEIVEGLDWTEYQRFAAGMDAAFVLMDTPHPSYPPLDMAAAGVAVLTNRQGVKTDLSAYSKNILMADADLNSLRSGLAALAALASQRELRRSNRANDAIQRSWSTALQPVIDQLELQFSGGLKRHVS